MQGPQAELPTLVRNYVHYDNLVGNYSKQTNAARKLRDEFEGKIIQNLRANHMENAVIQISGAKLQCTTEKSVPSLTMPRLEDYLHKYFAQKGNNVDETEQILRFLRLQKTNDTTVVACLKKIPVGAAIPPPPGSARLQ